MVGRAMSKVRLDPHERDALYAGLMVGMTVSPGPGLSADERGSLFYGVLRDLSQASASSRPLKLAVPRKLNNAIRRTLTAALESDDARLEVNDRTVLPQLLRLFQ